MVGEEGVAVGAGGTGAPAFSATGTTFSGTTGDAAYVARVQALTAANVRDGVLLPEEAQRTVDEAQATSFSCAS